MKISSQIKSIKNHTLETCLCGGLKFTLMRLLFEVDCHDVLLGTVFNEKVLAKLTLLRHLFEVDCHDLLLETALLWEYVLAKFTSLLRLLFDVD